MLLAKLLRALLRSSPWLGAAWRDLGVRELGRREEGFEGVEEKDRMPRRVDAVPSLAEAYIVVV